MAGRGRPKVVFSKEMLVKVEALAAYLTTEQIADYFGIGRTTFNDLMNRQPDFYEHYKRGQAKAIKDIAGSLIKQAREGNTTAQMFYLKTRAGWRETQVIETKNNQPVTINIKSPKDEY